LRENYKVLKVHNSVHSFSSKTNCTEMPKSPDETDTAQSRSLLQMRDSPTPGQNPDSSGLQFHTLAPIGLQNYEYFKYGQTQHPSQ